MTSYPNVMLVSHSLAPMKDNVRLYPKDNMSAVVHLGTMATIVNIWLMHAMVILVETLEHARSLKKEDLGSWHWSTNNYISNF